MFHFNSLPFLLLLASLLSYLFSVTVYAAPSEYRLRAHQQAFTITTEDDVRSEIEFGQGIAARLLGKIPVYNNRQVSHYVSLVGKTLALQSGRPEISFHFAVLDLEKINAYSTPGGYIFITRGALRNMQDESELAAVLAHEIAHITQKHIVNEFKIRASDDSSRSSVTRLVGASSDSARLAFFQAIDKAMEVLLSRGFKHEDENESDSVATLLLAQTGYDPTALHRFLARAQQIEKQNKALKSNTHPTTNERLDALMSLILREELDSLGLPRGEKRFKQYVNF